MTLPAILALTGVAAATLVLAWLLVRSRDKWPALPAWDWAIIIKGGAFLACVGGAGVLTLLYWQGHIERHAMLVGLVDRIAEATADEPLAGLAKSLADGWNRDMTVILGGILVTLFGVSFLMTPRRAEVEAGWFKAKFDGGDAPAEALGARKVAAAAEAKAEQIADAAVEPVAPYTGPDLSEAPASDAPEEPTWR